MSANSKHNLNKRELEVLKLVAADQTNKQIAESLQISQKTVNNHLLYVYAKLGVNGRAGAVAIAIAKGLLEINSIYEQDKI